MAVPGWVDYNTYCSVQVAGIVHKIPVSRLEIRPVPRLDGGPAYVTDISGVRKPNFKSEQFYINIRLEWQELGPEWELYTELFLALMDNISSGNINFSPIYPFQPDYQIKNVFPVVDDDMVSFMLVDQMRDRPGSLTLLSAMPYSQIPGWILDRFSSDPLEPGLTTAPFTVGHGIAAHNDVVVENPVDGQVLVYSAGVWVNSDNTGGGGPGGDDAYDDRYLRLIGGTLSGNLAFSGADRQQISFGLNRGIGTQPEVLYARTPRFNVYAGGSHAAAANDPGTGGEVVFSVSPTVLQYKGFGIWHSGNDGAGSGLDADLLDGYQSAEFPRKAENAIITGAWTYNSTLRVKGATTLESTLAVSGATTLGSTLAVAGTSKFSGNVGILGDPSTYALHVHGSVGVVSNLYFGSVTRQMINLHSTQYGIGVQSNTLYNRSNKRFSWFVAGEHSDGEASPGAGGVILLNLAKDVDGGAVFHTRLEGPGFISGFTGSGWRRTQDGDDEIRSLTVRGRMRVYELLLSRISVTNGSRFATGGMNIDSLDQSGLAANQYRIYPEPGQLTPFLLDDLVQARRWDSSQNELSIAYGRVSYVAPDSTYIIVDTGSQSDPPVAGMTLARYGSTTDASRRGGIYETTDDTYAPYIDIWDGLSNIEDYANIGGGGRLKVRLGRLDGMGSLTLLPGTRNQFVVTPSGYGLVTTNGIFSGKIAAQEGRIASWTLAENRLSATFNSRSVILGEVATNVSYGFQAKGVDGEINVVSYTNVGAVMYWYRNASNEVLIGDDYRGVLSGAGMRMRRGGTDVFKFDDNGLYVNGNGTFTGTIYATNGYIGTTSQGWAISSTYIRDTSSRMFVSSYNASFSDGANRAILGPWTNNTSPGLILRGSNTSRTIYMMANPSRTYGVEFVASDGAGNQVGIGDLTAVGQSSHFGLLVKVSNTVLLRASNGSMVLGGWKVSGDRLYSDGAGTGNVTGLRALNGANNLAIYAGATDSFGNGAKFYVTNSGSGRLANGGIIWDATGNVRISGTLTAATVTGTVSVTSGSIIAAGGAVTLNSSGINLTNGDSLPSYIKWTGGGSIYVNSLGELFVIPANGRRVYHLGDGTTFSRDVLISRQNTERGILDIQGPLSASADAASPADRTARIYVYRDSSGKEWLCARFSNGHIHRFASNH